MRLIDADELMEHVWRDKLDSRELIAKMVDNAPTEKQKTAEWIPVSDPPKTDGRYLTYIENNMGNYKLSYMMVCDYINGSWCPDDSTASSNVTYWMYLPVEPKESRIGHWIITHRNGVNMYVCSECHNEPLLIGESYPIIKLSDYCPYCGIKMEVVKECKNCKHYEEDLHGSNCRFCNDMNLWEMKE